ncbi:monocarboxylate transporter 12-like [Amphiura filiformis]|uniref:monocarboxylate transporter 12-like n=1 Tax=Amphiura filiformis TaxID=82378 RepID=UPI003B2242B3
MSSHRQKASNTAEDDNVCNKREEMETSETKIPAYMDRGWAWVVLAGCFTTQMLSVGMFWCFGIFLLAWEEQLTDSVTKLQWIVSLLLLTAHVSAVIGSTLCKVYTIRQVALIGTTLATTSFVFASFSTTLWHLYATFAIAGIGLGIVMESTMVILVYYFKKRLGRANGIAHTACGLALFIIPPLAQFLIDQYGWQGALLIIAGLVANSGVGSAVFRPSPIELEIRHKLNNNKITEDKKYMELTKLDDKAQNGTEQTYANSISHDMELGAGGNISKKPKCKPQTLLDFLLDVELLKSFKCLSLFTAFFWFGLGYTLVTMFMPARAANVGISPYRAAILVSIMGATSSIARLTHGCILDYNIMSVKTLTATSNIVNALCCILNPLSDKYAYLATVSAVVGFSTGVTNSVIPVVAADFVGTRKISEAVAFTLVTFGLGTLVGSCMTGVLVDQTNSYALPFILAGISFFLSTLFIFSTTLSAYIRKYCYKKPSHQPIDTEDNATGKETRQMSIHVNELDIYQKL